MLLIHRSLRLVKRLVTDLDFLPDGELAFLDGGCCLPFHPAGATPAVDVALQTFLVAGMMEFRSLRWWMFLYQW